MTDESTRTGGRNLRRQAVVPKASAFLGIALAAVLVLAPDSALAQVAGSTVPTGQQDYFVLGHEQHVWNMMQRVRLGEGGGAFQNGMNSVVSAVSSADGQVVTYDHWEDGYETDPWNPVQASTLVLGDDDPLNGSACSYTNDPRVAPCDGSNDDLLFQGSALTLNSDQGLGGGCAAGVQCTVPVNPRVATDVRFDGGDRIVTSGGPLSLIHNQFPPPYPQIGGATEVLPRQAFAGATSYSIPAGENLYAPGGPFQIFNYTSVNLVAFDDNTQIFINSPGGGSVSLTLNRGQHYSNCLTWNGAFNCTGGAIDATPAPAVTINAGTKISSTAPVAILLFSGGDGTWATDFMPILPDLLHGNDYILPSPGDNPFVQGSRPFNIYPYNPDPVNALLVTATDTVGTSTIALGAGATTDYESAVGRYVPAGSTVRLTAPRNFWGLAIHDSLSPSNDWGYSWLATDFLTRTYTVSFAPGVNDPGTSSLPAQRTGLPPDADCTIPPAGAGLCNSINRSPVFVAASLDNTLVKVDFDNDGVFDFADIDGDDYPDDGVADDGTCGTPAPPWNVPGLTTGCLYRVDALQTLRIFDYTDYDNTGTNVQANKAISVAYGQDTDRATGPDPILDTGYTVYPLSQRFLDPVLVAGKTVSPTVVPSTGGQATFTISAHSYVFDPLTGLVVTDLLPAGLSQADYVGGSTLITYPDLSQGTADPSFSIDPGTGRTLATWTLSPDTMGQDQVVIVRYTLAIPAGGPRTFVNNASASAVYAGRTYTAEAAAEVVRTSVSVTKLVTDDGAPEPGDVLTYSLLVTNSGPLTETNVVLTDPIPPDTTFVAGSIGFPAPFTTGAFDPAQNAVVFQAAALPPGPGVTLTFQVRINPGADVGRLIANSAIYESDVTPTFYSNQTLTLVVGPALVQAKSIVGGIPVALHPGEVVTFEVQATNTGAGTASSVLVSDPLGFSNTTYVAGTMSYSVNGAAFVALTDAADADPGTLTGTTVALLLASLGPNGDVRFRFQATVDPATSGLAVNNQATVSAAGLVTSDTNLVQVPIVGTATVTGRVFLDVDGDGTQDAGEPGLADVTVQVTDSTGVTQLVQTNASGDYSAVVPPGSTQLDVDQADPDVPPGSVLTTANDPQNVVAVGGATVASGPVGYDPPPISVSKVSDAGGDVLPGETVTYAVTVRNNTGATQTGITLSDVVPTGTTYVPGSAQISVGSEVFRVTEYYIPDGVFGGATYTLDLNQPLAADYFAIVQGSAGSGGSGGDRGPDADYASLVQDGAGTGELAASGSSSQLVLQRQDGADSWVGVVTVVECLSSCATAGFRLLDVQRVTHLNGAQTGNDTSAVAWSNINQVMLLGGPNGAGCDTTDGTDVDHKNCHVRLYPSGTNQINWTRDNGGSSSMATATSTVMVLEWGSEWTVQRRRVQGNNGGANVDAAGEYNAAAINPVARAQTWVWGTGHTDDSGVGEAMEGVLYTVGNGVAQNAVENQIAVGANYNNLDIDFEMYALTHPGLAAGHSFAASAGTTNLLTTTVAVPAAAPGTRMALVSNSLEDNGDNYPRPILSARYTAGSTVQLERRRSGSEFAAWVQGIDLAGLNTATSLVCDDTLATCNEPSTSADVLTPANGRTLAPGSSLVLTFQVVVNADAGATLASIDNTAEFASAQNPGPASDTVSDTLVIPAVDVEPNNAGYANAGETIRFTHVVVNTGAQVNSFDLTVRSERGWRVDLIDPDTGVVLASDTDGDGTWDAGTPPNTGSLAPGASREYQLRAWVPPGTLAGTQDTVILSAASVLGPFSDEAEDEITVLPAGSTGQVIVTPDNSGVVQAGSYTAYAHRVINNTALPDTFDLAADTLTPGFTSTIHWDTNGDGVYTPGTDLQITNTAQLPPGASQLIFTVVNAPPGAIDGTVDVTHLTATSRNVNTLFGAATDTSTVVSDMSHDLSGGGSRVVAPGDVSVHPGTVVNLGTLPDRFDLDISPANLFGVDGLAHASELWVDTGADGIPDTLIASDADGDGTWDFVDPGWDTNGNGLPDVLVAGSDEVAYELRRAVAPGQVIQRDHVTLTSTSIGSPSSDPDNVTATWVFAALTRAGIRGLTVDPAGEVAFVTSTQTGTESFRVYETADPTGRTGRMPLHLDPVLAPVADSLTPILYRVPTRPVTRTFLMIAETETDGDVNWKGPFRVGDARLRRGFEKTEAEMDRAGVAREPIQRSRGMRPAGPPGPSASGRPDRGRRTARLSTARASNPRRLAAEGVKVLVDEPGIVEISAEALRDAGLVPRRRTRGVTVSNLGRAVPSEWHRDDEGRWILRFIATPLSTDYSGRSVYVITEGGSAPATLVPLTDSSLPETPGFTRVERNVLYVPSLPDGPDPWQWDLLVAGWPWPDPSWDPAAGDFDLPDLAPGAAGAVAVRVQLTGYTSHRHTVTAAINGMPVGSITFEGLAEATLEGSIPAEMLHATGNKLSATYVGELLPESPAGYPEVYLDFVDLAVPTTAPTRAATFEVEPWAPRLPARRLVEYLIVTDPAFRAEADRLAALKRAEGLRSVVVETSAAYDHSSGGVVEPLAIRELIRDTFRRSGRLRYVVLFGDDTFDPRDYVGTGARSFVPSLFARDGSWGLVPSETPYSDVDDDGRPDVAIGRLPVQTAGEARAVVDKIAAQAASLSPLRGAQLVVADNSTDTDAPFRDEAVRALALLPPTPEVLWSDVSAGPDAARDALVGAWQSGVMASHYFGHGGLTEWADEQVLTVDDVAALGPTWKPTVLFTWACLSQWHLGLFGPSLNEALLLQPGGGTVASFGPAGITPPARQAPLIEALYSELGREDITLGEAIRNAKTRVQDEAPQAREVIDGFHLFGDPALRLPWPAPEPR